MDDRRKHKPGSLKPKSTAPEILLPGTQRLRDLVEAMARDAVNDNDAAPVDGPAD